jgi:hypothetical protein
LLEVRGWHPVNEQLVRPPVPAAIFGPEEVGALLVSVFFAPKPHTFSIEGWWLGTDTSPVASLNE